MESSYPNSHATHQHQHQHQHQQSYGQQLQQQQPQPQRTSSYHSTHTPTHNPALSPFHPSPQGLPGTAHTSPHSIVGSTGPPSVSHSQSQAQGQNPGQQGDTHPSPLVPAYLTRFPTPNHRSEASGSGSVSGSALPGYHQSSPTNTTQHQHQHHQRPAEQEMYGRPSTTSDRYPPVGSGPGPTWPAIADPREIMKEERAWSHVNPSPDERERMYSNSGFTNGHAHSHATGSSHNETPGHESAAGTGSGIGNITHPLPHSSQSQSQNQQVFPSSGPTAKRGSKACVACRKGKNRCEWDPSGSESSCRRCLLNNTPCIFEKAPEKGGGRARNESVSVSDGAGPAESRVQSLEKTVQTLAQSQDQIQSTLQQILAVLPQSQSMMSNANANPMPSYLTGHNGPPTAVPPSSIFPSSVSPPSIFPGSGGSNNQHHPHPHAHGQAPSISGSGSDHRSITHADDLMIQAFTTTNNGGVQRTRSPQNTATGRSRKQSGSDARGSSANKKKPGDFPKLPGFAPPNHQFGTYGVIPLPSAPPSPSRSRHSSRSSSSHSADSSSALRQETLTAPIQALQALANAADQIAKTSPDQHLASTGTGGGEGDEDHERGLEDVDEKDINLDLDVDDDGPGGAGEGSERGRNRKRKRVGFDFSPLPLSFRVKKKKRPDPTPRNPFPDVVTKGLVSEDESRELWDIFFEGCHYFVPLFDKSYDTYETFIERTPFSMNALLAIAAKIRAGNGPLGQTFQRCLEEAQGIARSTLFGPIVRKEAVIAMLLLSVWSQNGWLPCGHALRMGLDMNLHRALDRLATKDEARTEIEERDLVVSARIWLNCYMHEHLVSLGTGKPLLLRDDSSVQRARDLLSHPMASETDMRLIAGVELVNLRIRILEHLTPLHGKVDRATISFVKRMLSDLSEWHKEWHAIHIQRYDDESVLVKLLETELVYAQLWTVCVALRGCQWDKLAPDQRELAFQAKDAAFRCLEIFLRSDNFRRHLKYATHDQLVSVAFAAVFLLKIAMLYPSAVPLPLLVSQVSQLAHLLSSECFAERYALTLRLMLSNFRRKTGALSTVPGTPRYTGLSSQGQGHGQTLPFAPGNNISAMSDLDGGLQSLLSLPTMDGFDPVSSTNGNGNGNGIGANGNGLPVGNGPGASADDINQMLNGEGIWDMGLGGFDWPTEFSPSSLPVWLQDGNFTDLGLPADGSDSLFLPLELANMFLPSGTQSNGLYQYGLHDSGDAGAEAW